jgi:hypothetical protein
MMCVGFAAASAAEPSPAAASTAAPAQTAAPCTPAALALREVSATAGVLPEAVYALGNRGAAACRISGAVGIQMFDAQGKPLPLRFGPNSTMATLLTLGPADEASFTVTYGRPGVAQCAPAARIDVYLAPELPPVSAATSFTACALPAVRVSSLRLGVPPAAGSPAPSVSPPPSVSPTVSPSPSPAPRFVARAMRRLPPLIATA